MKNAINEFGKVIIVALVIISIIGVTAGLSMNNSTVKSSITNLINGISSSGDLNNGGNSGGGNSGGNVNYGKAVLVGDLSDTNDENSHVTFTLYDSGVGIVNGEGKVRDDTENGTEYDTSWDFISMYLCGFDNYEDYWSWSTENSDEAYKDEIIQCKYKFNKLIIDENVKFPLGLIVAHLPITDLEIKGNVTAPSLELSYLKNLRHVDIANSVNIETFAGFDVEGYGPTLDNLDFLNNDSFKYIKGTGDKGLSTDVTDCSIYNVINLSIPDKFNSNNFAIGWGKLKYDTKIKSITFGKNIRSIQDGFNSKSSVETIRFNSDLISFMIRNNQPLCNNSALKDIYLPAKVTVGFSNKNIFKTNNTAIIHCPNENVREVVLANGAVNPDNVVID